jgi:hypothetical protein
MVVMDATLAARGERLIGAVTTLEEAGYIEISKTFIGNRPRTSARLNTVGRAPFEQHVAAPQAIVARSGASVFPD